MTPSKIFNQIKTDRFYLINSYLIDSALMSILILAILSLGWKVDYDFGITSIALIIIAAIINGLFISSLLHNTSHSNVPTKLLNRILGEYCGYWVLYGFTNFCLVHILHHQHSDNELDPVNPKGMTFLVFVTAPMRYMIKVAKSYLTKNHGHHKEYALVLNVQTIVFNINILMRLSIWYLLLGKVLFFSFFIPGILTIIGIFAHINYACHRDNIDGSVEIVNLDHNLYYKIANFFTMGGYFHKNHHLNMNLINPKFLKSKRARQKLITVEANVLLKKKSNLDYSYKGSAFSKYFNINKIWGEGDRNRSSSLGKLERHSANRF